ncbi:MAG: DUF4190 domain-containing protein [Saprospiraceae bacterium]|nr:DUF4190 domain-containing protein [Pyrinomonadaceae bacterium]
MAIKKCSSCGQTYTDDAINFCLNDGELLNYLADDVPQTIFGGDERRSTSFDDSPPTVLLNRPRVTNQTNWPPSSPPDAWQSQMPVYQNQQFGMANYSGSADQTIPTVSLVLGIVSIVMVCCYGGIWLGLPAAILGYMGMRNADNDPGRYGGRGLAIAGMVIGIATCLLSIVHIIVLIFSMLAS